MYRYLLLVALLALVTGCDDKAKPTPALSDEQKAKIKADDKAIADEESQGSVGKKKK